MTYTLLLNEMDGTPVLTDVIADTIASEIRFGFALNGVPTITFDLPILGPEVTQANFEPGARLLNLKQDGTSIWQGFLLGATTTEDTASFAGKGWEWLLSRRLITGNEFYAGVEQLDVAWDLVDTYAGDFGFTRASLTPSGKERHRHYCCDELTNVLDALQDLAGSTDGFDFWITPGKAFTTASEFRGTDRSGTVTFDDTVNVTNVDFTYDYEEVTNRLWFVPPKLDECGDLQLRDFEGSPADLILESGEDYSDIPHADDRNDLATESLRNSAPVKRQVVVTVDTQLGVDFGDFDLGDTVHLTLTRGYNTMDEDMKVLDYEATLAEDCVSQLVVTLDNLVTA